MQGLSAATYMIYTSKCTDNVMSTVNSLLLEGLRELGTEVSRIRADFNAQTSSQLKSTRPRRGRDKSRDSSAQQPWENIQSRLDGIDSAVRRLESIASGAFALDHDHNVSGHMRHEKVDSQAIPAYPNQDMAESEENSLAGTEGNKLANGGFNQSQLLAARCRPASRPLTSDDATDPSAIVVLSSHDMGKRLVSKLAHLERRHAPQKMAVPKFDIDLAEMQRSVRADNDWQYTSIRYKAGPRGKGYAMAYISSDKPKPELDYSALITAVERPSVAEAKDVFEKAINNPPIESIPYFTGHAKLLPIDRLDPGKRITADPSLTDLHFHYNHIGAHLSANRMHCEDMTYSIGPKHYGFRSFNEVYAGTGYKLWLLIASRHITKFNDFFAKTFKCGTCNQKVGHKSILIAPSRLDKEGIEYTIEVIGRGEAFRTLPGQPHQVINFGACAARSINYLHEDDIFEPENVDYCCECGIAGASLVPSPPQVLHMSTPAKRPYPYHQTLRATRRWAEVVKQLDKNVEIAREADSLCDIPHIDRTNPCPLQVDVLLMAASVRSKFALDQLFTLTQALLQQQSGTSNLTESVDNDDVIDYQIRFLRITSRDSVYACYLVRHAQVCLAREVDKKKTDGGFNRAKTEDLQERAKRLGMSNIDYHLQEGRNWIVVCGPHQELQPLVLLGSKVLGNRLVGSRGFGVTSKKWHALRGERLGAFHRLLDDPLAQRLFAAGRLFLQLMDKVEQPTLAWENVLQEARQAHDLDSSLTSYMKLTK